MPRRSSPPLAAQAAPKTYASSTDVARLAGVSQSAVSRTFTKGASVSARTRQKVQAAAEQLGYRPSALPRILITRKSRLVAVVIGGMYNPYYANLVEMFSRECQKNGNQVLLFSVDHGEYIDEAIPLLASYRVDAIISALSILSDEAAAACAKMRVPVVLFNGRIQNKWVHSVCCDNVQGGREVADLFVARGARRFGYITGKETLANRDRCAGYVGRLRELGHGEVAVAPGNYRFEGGYQGASELLKHRPRPDAIFCANDLTALGALDAARTVFRLKVPRDLLVAGFDDIPAASWPSYNLTTVRPEASSMVAETLRIVQVRTAAPERRARSLSLIPGTLVERASTRR